MKEKINNEIEKVPKILLASKNDVSGILAIQEAKLLKRKDDKQDPNLQNTGFLVNELSEKDLNDAIENNQTILIVAKDNEKVVGYMFGYDFNKLLLDNPNWLNQTDIDKSFFDDKKVIYGKHVASNGSFFGTGDRLSQKFYEIAKSKGYTFYIGEILESPIKNERSILKHPQLNRIGKYTDINNNFIWGVYSKIL